MKAGKLRAWTFAGLAVLLLAACDDDSGTGNNGNGGDGGGNDAGDSGGGGDQGEDDQGGGGDQGENDQGGGDGGENDQGGGGDQGDDVPLPTGRQWITDDCAEFNPDDITWPDTLSDDRPVRLIIEAVDFVTDTIVVRNVTDANVVITSGNNWRLCADGATGGVQSNCVDMASGYNISAGERVAIHITRLEGETQPADNENELWVWWTVPAGGIDAPSGEVGLRDLQGGIVSAADTIENFVRWGNDPNSQGASGRDEAVLAGAWVSDEAGAFVAVDSEAVGIIATGDVSDPADWVEAGDNCFLTDVMP